MHDKVADALVPYITLKGEGAHWPAQLVSAELLHAASYHSKRRKTRAMQGMDIRLDQCGCVCFSSLCWFT